jgi:hypothetical protein
MNEWAFGLHLEQCEVNMKMNVKNPNIQDKERKKEKGKKRRSVIPPSKGPTPTSYLTVVFHWTPTTHKQSPGFKEMASK